MPMHGGQYGCLCIVMLSCVHVLMLCITAVLPLMQIYAAIGNQANCIDLLLEAGANVSSSTNAVARVKVSNFEMA